MQDRNSVTALNAGDGNNRKLNLRQSSQSLLSDTEYVSAGFLVTGLGHQYGIHSAEHYSGGTEKREVDALPLRFLDGLVFHFLFTLFYHGA